MQPGEAFNWQRSARLGSWAARRQQLSCSAFKCRHQPMAGSQHACSLQSSPVNNFEAFLRSCTGLKLQSLEGGASF